MTGRSKRQQTNKTGSGSKQLSYTEDSDGFDEEDNLDEELEAEEELDADNSLDDIMGYDDDEDDGIPDDGELDADDGYEEAFDEEDGYEDDYEEFGGRKPKAVAASSSEPPKGGLKIKFKKESEPANNIIGKRRGRPKAQLVTIKYKSSTNLLITLKLNKKKLSKIVNPKKPKKGPKNSIAISIAKDNARKRNAKVSYLEPNEDDDFGSDIDDFDSIAPDLNGDENEDEDEENLDIEDDEDIVMDDDESDVDLSKLSERQRYKVLGISEEPEDLTPEFYKGKKLPKSVLALMQGAKSKKPLTEEEIQLRKAEAARKRKTFNMRKLEAEKKETLKKLLHRKIEKVDAKKQEIENERRKQNQLVRKELITHKALFRWTSKTEVVDGDKKSVSLYSMQ